MLELKQIEAYYPEALRPFSRNLVVEYLQYKILEIIYDSTFGEKLWFMGGTAARVVYGNARFSEDLDFDNRGLSSADLEEMTRRIIKRMELEGYAIESRNVFRKAFTCYLRFPGLLYDMGLSGHRGEKILIKLNAEPQGVLYRQDKVILNRFDVFVRIGVVPVDLLLAQKIAAIFGRSRPMGRDFYDVVFLLGMTEPNYIYLENKLKIKDRADLKKQLLKKCDTLDMKALAADVKPFLFSPADAKRVLLFRDYIDSLDAELR
jgi:predicted nucleotidyltransferase component of viral defense system